MGQKYRWGKSPWTRGCWRASSRSHGGRSALQAGSFHTVWRVVGQPTTPLRWRASQPRIETVLVEQPQAATLTDSRNNDLMWWATSLKEKAPWERHTVPIPRRACRFSRGCDLPCDFTLRLSCEVQKAIARRDRAPMFSRVAPHPRECLHTLHQTHRFLRVAACIIPDRPSLALLNPIL
jgi:hypothetical protein